jgi:hypothetical protein
LSFQIVQYECQQQQLGMVEGFDLEQKMRECTLTNGGASSRENEPTSVTAQPEQQNGHANIQGFFYCTEIIGQKIVRKLENVLEVATFSL